MSEEQLMAVSRLIHDAKVRQAAADRLAEAQQAEDEARQLADARELEARQREVERRQNEVTARIEARRAAQEREAKARKAAEEKAKQERKWKEESRRAEYEWRQEEYRKQQHAEEQSSESKKRRRLIDETTNAPSPPLLRITRDKILEWHKTCEALKNGDKSALRSFPQPPYEICLKKSCAVAEKTRAVKACRCNIMKCFNGRNKATLKVDRLAFRLDKFSTVQDDVRDRIQQAAKEIFSAVQEMYSNA
ncbi:hypothetical protein LTR10_006283 [Elasticomyces elasticus]|nr:hypothetical protein LTR10_006283 [Elasticomyces elasticus]KAK4966667.1 hypothetical protein LTR42_010978 [Elasticomyces elasticus]